MKFGKEFKQQKVPEWIEAYMDYNGLKRILHEIRQFKQLEEPPSPLRTSSQRLSVYRPFSGLDLKTSSDDESTHDVDVEEQVVAVETVRQDDATEVYNTNFLMSPKESEITFFEKFDEELNKVNTFYRDKVEEVISEAASLNKQMNALIALRIKVEQPDINKCHIHRTDSSSIGERHVDEEQVIEMNDLNSSSKHSDKESKFGKDKSDPLDVLDRVKLLRPKRRREKHRVTFFSGISRRSTKKW